MISKKAYVIGGGPLGLGVSSKLIENGYLVVIIEASDKLLGLASTFTYDNYEIEKFYNFFYKNDNHNSLNWLQKYSSETPSIYWKNISTDSVVSGLRYNLDSIISVFRLCCFKVIKVFFTILKVMLFKPSQKLDSQSAVIWARNYFGDKFANQVWIPLLKQKFGNRFSDVSALWLATRVKRHLSTRGKGLGKSQFGYLENTYVPFVEKFKKHLISSGGEIFLNNSVNDLIIDDNKISKIITNSKEFNVENSPVFSTISYAILKSFFIGKPYLKGLDPFVNMGVIVCILISNKLFSDHYWTTVSDENYEFAAIIQQNRLFAKSKEEIVYLSRYCMPNDKLFSISDDLIYDNWIKSITEIYPHITKKDIKDFKIIRSKNAAPLPFMNSKKKLSKITSNLTNFYFSGYESIFPEDRGVGNSIKLGYELFEKFKENLK